MKPLTALNKLKQEYKALKIYIKYNYPRAKIPKTPTKWLKAIKYDIIP